jgi:putative hydrolase of the HAD superfamily
MIKAIVFDFGRVISAQKPMSLFRKYEEDLGLAPDVLNQVMFESPAWQEVLVGQKGFDVYWREIGPALGLHTQGEIDSFRQRYHDDEALNEGVVSVIRGLRGRFRLAVLSNAPPGLPGWLADWGILELFDLVFCSGDEGVAKPDHRAFLLTLERLGVAAGEAAFIDDTLGHVEAARALGLHGIHFTNAQELSRELDCLLASN